VLLAIWREWLHETNEFGPFMMPKSTMAYDLDDDKDDSNPDKT